MGRDAASAPLCDVIGSVSPPYFDQRHKMRLCVRVSVHAYIRALMRTSARPCASHTTNSTVFHPRKKNIPFLALAPMRLCVAFLSPSIPQRSLVYRLTSSDTNLPA